MRISLPVYPEYWKVSSHQIPSHDIYAHQMDGRLQVNSHYRHPSPWVGRAMVSDKEANFDQDGI